VIGRRKLLDRGRTSRTSSSIEFGDMLDRIQAPPVTADDTHSVAPQANGAAPQAERELADLVMFPIVSKAEPEIALPVPVVAEPLEQIGEPSTTSRFADAGIDDDRLPIRAPRFRRLHR